MKKRLEHNDMMVPWITRWEGEANDWTTVTEVYNGFRFRRRCELTSRTGDPLFAEVHSARSWEAATRNLCQVCGLRGADIYRTWGEHSNPQPTLEAPLHQQCLLTSLAQCPHLVHGAGDGDTVDGLKYEWWKCHARQVIGGLFSLPEQAPARLFLFEKMTEEEREMMVLRQPLVDIMPIEHWTGAKLWMTSP